MRIVGCFGTTLNASLSFSFSLSFDDEKISRNENLGFVREQMTADFTTALVEHGKPWAMLTGTLEARLTLAERVVDDIVLRRFALTDPI